MADDLLAKIRSSGEVPHHIAIIMDGYGRWARSRFLPRPMGHRAGVKSVRETVNGAIDAGVRVITIFAFSQENWLRPQSEVGALMALLQEFVAKEITGLQNNGVEVSVLGEIERLGPGSREAVDRLVAQTAGGEKLSLNICVSYGSRAEIVRAARSIAQDVKDGKSVDDVTEEYFASKLYTSRWPDPVLLIRTSGELRISNFLLWQLAYTEIYVTDVLWPDFDRQELYRAIEDYQGRDRRYGKVSV